MELIVNQRWIGIRNLNFISSREVNLELKQLLAVSQVQLQFMLVFLILFYLLFSQTFQMDVEQQFVIFHTQILLSLFLNYLQCYIPFSIYSIHVLLLYFPSIILTCSDLCLSSKCNNQIDANDVFINYLIMKQLKKLQPLSQRKQIDDQLIEKLKVSMKMMVTCFSQLSSRLNKDKYRSKDSGKIDSSRLAQSNPQKTQTENHKQYNTAHTNWRNETRKQQRFQNIDCEIKNILAQDKQKRITQILDWIGVVCKEVLSTGFLIYKTQELDINKIKSYCSQNIMRNILMFAQVNKLTPEQFKAINECLRDQIFPYFCLKYPQSEQSEVNLSFASQLIESNNIGENINDLVFKSEVKFFKQENGNYNSQIMRFLNYIIRLPNKTLKSNLQADEEIIKKQSVTLTQNFSKQMQSIFRMIENQNNVINMKKFDPKYPDKKIEKFEAKEQQKQKQQYLQKVRSYTSFQIGQKLSSNFKIFSENEIQSGILILKNTSIMRVVTKWCEQLWSYFDQDQMLNREYQFRMKNGSEQFFKKQLFLDTLNRLLQRQKKHILEQLDQIQQNNYEQQSSFAQKRLHEKLRKFTEDQGLVGQFSTVIYKNTENYLIKYLNLLIHGICVAIEDFQKFLKIAIHKQWVFSNLMNDLQIHKLRKISLDKIMEVVELQGQVIFDVSSQVPQLITFKVGDLLRCKCSSRENQIIALYKELQRISHTHPQLLKIVRVKNRLEGGNKDILMNLMFRQQLLVQVQLAINSEKSKFITCSNKFNHFIYELRRAQFGPISQMCSIWTNQDQRSSYYLKFFDKNNKRAKIKNQNGEQLINKACCKKNDNLKFLKLPFTCNSCQSFYYDCGFTQKHIFCKECLKNTCFLCRAEHSSLTQAKQIIPQLQTFKIQKIQFLNSVPKQGGGVLNIKQKDRKIKFFKTFQYDEDWLLFQAINSKIQGQPLRINLIGKFIDGRISQQFLKQNIIFTFPNINQFIPKITNQMIKQQYFISLILKEAQKSSKKTVTVTRKKLDHTFFQFYSDLSWPAAKKINFSENSFQNIDLIYEKFPDIRLAILNSNSIKRISSKCANWTNIESLHLANNQISTIHGNIKYLKNLQQLNLKSNILESLPPQIGDLQKLKILNLDCNKITTFPKQIGNLKNLKELNVCFPETFGMLESLENLIIFHTGIQHLPQSFGNLKSLQQFNVSHSSLISLSKNFGHLSNLKKIDLSLCKIQGLPQSFGKLLSLKILKAPNNQIKKLSANFGELSSLQDCNLYSNQITQLPDSLGSLSSLIKLNLSRNKLLNLSDSLCSIPNLKVLLLSDNKITQLNEKIYENQSIMILHLGGNKISRIPQGISKMEKLKILGADENNLKIESIPQDFKNLKNLSGVSFGRNKFTQFPQILKQMNWLRQLHVEEMQIKQLPIQLLNFSNLAMFQISKQKLDEKSNQILLGIKKIIQGGAYERFIKQYQELMRETKQMNEM